MEKRKITFTVTNDLTYDQRMQKICNSLAAHSFEVLLVGRRMKNSLPFNPENFSVKRLHCIFNKGFLFYAEYNFRLFFFLLMNKQHIISSVDLDTLMACSLASSLKKNALAFDAHEYFTEVPEVTHRPLVKKVWSWIEKVFIKRAQICYTVGEILADVFSKNTKKHFEVIRNVPFKNDIEFNTNEWDNQTPKFILYQGALNESRGIENMILAMQNLDNLEFHIVGEGILGPKLKSLVSEKNLEKKVKFLGFMPPEELKKYTLKAYLGLNVSENNGLSYYYSLNNKFFDYAAAGLPQLLNKFPEYEKLNQENEVGILCHSIPEELVNAVKNILMEDKKYLKLKYNCSILVNQYHWEAETKKLVKMYESIRI